MCFPMDTAVILAVYPGKKIVKTGLLGIFISDIYSQLGISGVSLTSVVYYRVQGIHSLTNYYIP